LITFRPDLTLIVATTGNIASLTKNVQQLSVIVVNLNVKLVIKSFQKKMLAAEINSTFYFFYLDLILF